MNFRLFILMFLLFQKCGAVKPARTVVIVHPANEDEFVLRSVFRALKIRKGQFSSKIQILLIDLTHYRGRKFEHKTSVAVGQSERYSFRSKSGTYEMDEHGSDSSIHLYTSGQEIHSVQKGCLRGEVDEHKFCDSRPFSQTELQHHLSRWLPLQVLEPDSNYDLLGLNVLLEIFYKTFESDKTSVKCETTNLADAEYYDWPIKVQPRKCSILFGQTVRLDYHFVSNENHTDYPTKIELHEQVQSEWKMTKEFRYIEFNTTFAEEQIVNSDLPVGHGCRRFGGGWRYPTIETDYGNRFELQLEVLFDYQLKNADFYDGLGAAPNRTTRVYPVRLLVDEADSFCMAETVDEETGASIRTYYEKKNHLLYSLADGRCSIFNLTSNRSLNWFFVQEMFARRPELFHATPNYSYLREFSLGNVPCLVFEETIDYRAWASDEYRDWVEGEKEDFEISPFDSSSTTTRPRKNNVPTENNKVITTHFYPKDRCYWPDNPDRLAIPKRIELTIFGRFHSVGWSRMVIDVKSFKSNPKRTDEYYLSRETLCDLKDKPALSASI